MEKKPENEVEHMFCIELKSKDFVKSLSVPNDEGRVSIEGFLGTLQSLRFTDGIIVEIDGSKGSLKLDLSEKELKRLLPEGAKNLPSGDISSNSWKDKGR